MKNETLTFLGLLTISLILIPGIGLGQTYIISPTGEGGFELGASLSANGWLTAQSGPDLWVVGTAATGYSGSRGAYISNDGGTSWAYTGDPASVNHLYRDVVFPAGEFVLSFDYAEGESMGAWGLFNVTLADQAVVPQAGVEVPGEFQETLYDHGSSYEHKSIYLSGIYAGTAKKLVFTWITFGGHNGKPPAIDNISLTATGVSSASWSPAILNNSLPVISICANNQGAVFAGTSGGGVFRGMDNGVSWANANFEIGTIFSLAGNSAGDVFFGSNYGIDRSTDNGVNWDPVCWLDARAIAITSARGWIFAVYGDVLRSTDNGTNWDYPNDPDGYLTDLSAVAVSEEDTVYVGSNSGAIFKSTDSGVSWSMPGSNVPVSILTLSVSPQGDIFAGTDGQGVYRSTNRGLSWVALGPPFTKVKSILFRGTQTYIATYGNGIYQSTDNGSSWGGFNTGLSNLNVNSIAISQANVMVAGTDAGAFARVIGTSTTCSISGRVTTTEGTAVPNVGLIGFPTSTSTNSSGDYSCVVPSSWSGTVTPSKTGYAFSPPNRSYSNLSQNQVNQNYTATISSSTSASISIKGNATVQMGTEFWVEVWVGDPTNVTDLYGLSFRLRSDQAQCTYVDGSAEAGAFLGTSPLPYFHRVDAQTVDMAVTKTSPPGVSGSGLVARARFTSPNNLTSSLPVVFSLLTPAAYNSVSGNIQLIPSSFTVTIQTCVAVWPGDNGNDGSVSAADILPIGLRYGQTRPGSNVPGPLWQIYCRAPWPNDDLAPKKVYADADGNGTIDAADVLPIGLNYGKTHPLNTSGAVAQAVGVLGIVDAKPDVVLTPDCSRRMVGGRNVLEVGVRMSSEIPVYGAAFKLNYHLKRRDGSTSVQIHPGAVDTAGSALKEVLMFSRVLENEQSVDAALTQIKGQGSKGDGRLAKIAFDLGDEDWGGATVSFEIAEAMAVTAEARVLKVQGGKFESPAMSVSEELIKPTTFILERNYPNPFNPITTITYGVPVDARVTLKVYDMLGREVAALVEGQRGVGTYRVRWEAKDVGGRQIGTGVYFYRLTAYGQSGEFLFTQTNRMIFVK